MNSLQPRAWPNATVVEQKCARTTWPFGEFSKPVLERMSIGLFVGFLALFVLYWVLSPTSIKGETVTTNSGRRIEVPVASLTLTRFAVMVLSLQLMALVLALDWTVMAAFSCYVEQLDNWEGYGYILASWCCLAMWTFTALCCLLFGAMAWLSHKQKKRAARNDVELQRRQQNGTVDNVELQRPAQLHLAGFQKTEVPKQGDPPPYDN